MKKQHWLGTAACLALVAGLGVGCGKKVGTKESAAQQPATAESKSTEATSVSTAKISGAQEVMAAIDKKDYDGAIAALLRIRQSVSTPEQQVQFATLADETRIKLLEAGPSNPNVAKALSALRMITGGR